MSGLTICLWFDGNAEEAANHYVSIFRACGRSASIDGAIRFKHGHQQNEDQPVTVNFTLDGQKICGLNGGPQFKLSPASSLIVRCRDQAEVDAFWEKLLEGGSPMECSWLTDKYGLPWQIVPDMLLDTLQDGPPDVRQRVADAMMRWSRSILRRWKPLRDAA
jgi:predicted 3-demethylubiquinone-9 3-methyltransferase (glyoxalase superfamily)